MPVWVWGWLEAFGFLQASNLEQLDLGLQAGFVQTRRMPVWVWGWLEAFRFFRWCPDRLLPILNNWIWVCKLDPSRPDGCQFGFGDGSRPFVSLDGAFNWMLPILNNWIWVCKLDPSRPDGCQFGFGGGSRPFVSLDGALTGCFQS